MQVKLVDGKLQVEGKLFPKEFKKGKEGWYLQTTVEVEGELVVLNFIAYKK